jgi:hypothetical protein
VVLGLSVRCRRDRRKRIVECVARTLLPSELRRLVVLVEHRYLADDQPAGMCAALRAHGHDVHLVQAEVAFETGDSRWLESAEIVVARGSSSELLSLVRAAERHGIPTIDRADAIAAVQNKGRLTARLEAGGVRTLAGYCTTEALRGTMADAARRRVVLHVADTRVWNASVDSPGPARPPSELVALASASQALRRVALRCGRLVGLRLYAVECEVTTDGPMVVDVREFPDYRDVPGASDALAELVIGSPASLRR